MPQCFGPYARHQTQRCRQTRPRKAVGLLLAAEPQSNLSIDKFPLASRKAHLRTIDAALLAKVTTKAAETRDALPDIQNLSSITRLAHRS